MEIIKKILINSTVIIILLVSLLLIRKQFQKSSFYLSEIECDIPIDNIFCCSSSDFIVQADENNIHLIKQYGVMQSYSFDFIVKRVDYDNKNALMISDSDELYMFNFSQNSVSEVLLHDVKLCRVFGDSYAAISNDGTLFVWGDNSNHIFSTSVPEIIEEPTKIETISDVADIRFNSMYSLLLTEDGDVYESGKNNDNSFSCIKELQNIQSINVGYGSLAVGDDGSVDFWFDDFYSGSESPDFANASYISQSCNNNKLKNFSTGTGYWVCSDNKKTLWCWGEDFLTKRTRKEIKFFREPTCLKGISGIDNVYPCQANIFVTKQDKIYIVKAHD